MKCLWSGGWRDDIEVTNMQSPHFPYRHTRDPTQFMGQPTVEKIFYSVVIRCTLHMLCCLIWVPRGLRRSTTIPRCAWRFLWLFYTVGLMDMSLCVYRLLHSLRCTESLTSLLILAPSYVNSEDCKMWPPIWKYLLKSIPYTQEVSDIRPDINHSEPPWRYENKNIQPHVEHKWAVCSNNAQGFDGHAKTTIMSALSHEMALKFNGRQLWQIGLQPSRCPVPLTNMLFCFTRARVLKQL